MIRAVGVARHVQRRAVPAVMNQQARTVTTAPKNWMERLLSVPKGWEKFYRKPGGSGGKGGENPGGSSGSGGPKINKSGGQGGHGGGGKKPDPGDAMNLATKLAVFVGTSIFITLALNEMSGNGRYVLDGYVLFCARNPNKYHILLAITERSAGKTSRHSSWKVATSTESLSPTRILQGMF